MVNIIPSEPHLVTLELACPPSVNKLYSLYIRRKVKDGIGYREVPYPALNQNVRRYYANNTWPLKIASRTLGLRPVDSHTTFEFTWWLPRKNYDNHNGLKVLCDLLQKGGIVTDDRFILPRVMAVFSNPKAPKVHVTFPKKPLQTAPAI